jgi:hypothetical protein
MVVPRAAALRAPTVAVRPLAAIEAVRATLWDVVRALARIVLEAAAAFLAGAALDGTVFTATLPDVPALCLTAVLVGDAAVCATQIAAPPIAAARQTMATVVHLHLRAIYAASPKDSLALVPLPRIPTYF